MKLQGLDHIALTVTDLKRSTVWYQKALNLERRHEEEWGDVPTFMCAGASGLALFPAETPTPQPDKVRAPGMQHVAFRADRRNFEVAQQRLKELNIEFVFQDHSIAHSIYFTDPDGHRLEITTYDL